MLRAKRQQRTSRFSYQAEKIQAYILSRPLADYFSFECGTKSAMENDIASLETTHRGFLLSGDQSYVDLFDRSRELIQHRTDALTALILDSPKQRKRVIKVQEVIQKWLNSVAIPEIKARQMKPAEP